MNIKNIWSLGIQLREIGLLESFLKSELKHLSNFLGKLNKDLDCSGERILNK